MNVAKKPLDFSNRVGLLSPSESHWLFELLSKPVTDWLLHPVFYFYNSKSPIEKEFFLF